MIVLTESGDVLVVYLDGRATRIRPDGSTVPPMLFLVGTAVESAIRIRRLAARERYEINQPSCDARRSSHRMPASPRVQRTASLSTSLQSRRHPLP